MRRTDRRDEAMQPLGLETERAVLLCYTSRDGKPRRGSGLRIGGAYVLTADHCADASNHTVIIDGREYDATVALRGSSDVDIAVLSVPALAALPPLACARVNTGIAARIEDCIALGFPTWSRRDGVDYRVQADGYVGTGEGANPRQGPAGGRLWR